MRRLVLLCGLFLALAVPAMAQDEEPPKFDLFGGFTYTRLHPIPNVHANLVGGKGSVGLYFNKHFGVAADFAGQHLSTLEIGSGSNIPPAIANTNVNVSGTLFTYLFGPRLRFPHGRFTPFVQVLFGGAHTGNVTCNTANPTCTNNFGTSGIVLPSANAFAMTAGGGGQIRISKHFSIRGNPEYLLTRFGSSTMKGARNQNNFRAAFGIVID